MHTQMCTCVCLDTYSTVIWNFNNGIKYLRGKIWICLNKRTIKREKKSVSSPLKFWTLNHILLLRWVQCVCRCLFVFSLNLFGKLEKKMTVTKKNGPGWQQMGPPLQGCWEASSCSLWVPSCPGAPGKGRDTGTALGLMALSLFLFLRWALNVTCPFQLGGKKRIFCSPSMLLFIFLVLSEIKH